MLKKTTLFLICIIQSIASICARTLPDVPEEAVRQLCCEMIEHYPAATLQELQKELRQAADLRAAVRHSDAFRNTYHPHYRIIRL